MNAQKNLRQLLNACVDRCKVADQFRDSVYEIARLAMLNPRERRAALIAICEMCDPKYVAPIATERSKRVIEVGTALSTNRGPGSPAPVTNSSASESQTDAKPTPTTVRNV